MRGSGKSSTASSRRAFSAFKLRVGQIAFALLLLQLGLDDVGVRHFAGGLALLGQLG